MEDNKPKLNKARVGCSVVYFLIGLILIIVRHDEMFYTTVAQFSYNFDRFLWCLSSSLIGFSFLAFNLRHHSKSPFPTYLYYYPAILIITSSLVFGIFHIFKETSGFNFYFLSFSACFILSYLVDNFWKLITSLVKR